MNKLRKVFSRLLVSVWSMAVVFAADVASAQTSLIPDRPSQLPDVRGTLSATIGYYINLFLGFAGLIAVVYIIIGGFRYITSAGNDEAAESGKKTLTNAVIGLVIIIFSYVIVRVVIQTLGAR